MKNTKLSQKTIEAKNILLNHKDHSPEQIEKAISILNEHEKPKYRKLHVFGSPEVAGIREYYTYKKLKIEICKSNGRLVLVRDISSEED